MDKIEIVKEYDYYFQMEENLFTGKEDESFYMKNYIKMYGGTYDNQKQVKENI